MNETCPHCHPHPDLADKSCFSVKCGFFRRKGVPKVQRFKCLKCLKTFSDAIKDPCYRQRKRSVNGLIFSLLSSGVSQRRLALLLKLNRKTVVRKFLFLADLSFSKFCETTFSLVNLADVEFDELETFEHSKCKPLSVPLAVESKTRKIIGFGVARMPAKGHLAKIALKKYGIRTDERIEVRREVLRQVSPLLAEKSIIRSDQNPNYPKEIKTHLPTSFHQTSKGQRGAITGQGELKKIAFDPLFSLNHTCAMLRANINRLFRKTWCTTKKPERLFCHLAIYAHFHNEFLLNS